MNRPLTTGLFIAGKIEGKERIPRSGIDIQVNDFSLNFSGPALQKCSLH